MSSCLTVRKSNALINAGYNFTTTEKRLVLMAIAQGKGNISDLHEITALEFAEIYKIKPESAYEALREAAKQLFERRFSWIEKTQKGNTKHIQSRWVSRVAYVDGEGVVEIRFSEDVLPLLTELKERFTAYDLKNIAHLSYYSIRLYELLIAWRSTKKTPIFKLENFREQLGILPDEYPRMTNFKQRVLDLAINQINEHSNITVKYKQHKKGRKISGFSFTYKMKSKAKKIASVKPRRQNITKEEAANMAHAGESWSDLIKRLSSDYNITNL